MIFLWEVILAAIFLLVLILQIILKIILKSKKSLWWQKTIWIIFFLMGNRKKSGAECGTLQLAEFGRQFGWKLCQKSTFQKSKYFQIQKVLIYLWKQLTQQNAKMLNFHLQNLMPLTKMIFTLEFWLKENLEKLTLLIFQKQILELIWLIQICKQKMILNFGLAKIQIFMIFLLVCFCQKKI